MSNPKRSSQTPDNKKKSWLTVKSTWK